MQRKAIHDWENEKRFWQGIYCKSFHQKYLHLRTFRQNIYKLWERKGKCYEGLKRYFDDDDDDYGDDDGSGDDGDDDDNDDAHIV